MSEEYIDLGVLNMTTAESKPEAKKKRAVNEDSERQILSVYKIFPDAELPRYATEGSGSFDVKVYLGPEVSLIDGFNSLNEPIKLQVNERDGIRFFVMAPGDRVLAPTGLIFDIPESFALHFIPRSSTGYKKDLEMPHSLGFVDSDYVEQSFIILKNASKVRVKIEHGERLAQAFLARREQISIKEIKNRPKQKTDRKGGIGHTGTK